MSFEYIFPIKNLLIKQIKGSIKIGLEINNNPIELLILFVFNKIQIIIFQKITTNISHKDFRWLPIP